VLERVWWAELAECVDAPDPEGFFEVENAADDGRLPDPLRILEALELCGACQIREECLARSAHDGAGGAPSYGIRGGLTASERGHRYRGWAGAVPATPDSGSD
jgi:hypothetical protein